MVLEFNVFQPRAAVRQIIEQLVHLRKIPLATAHFIDRLVDSFRWR